MPVTTCKSARLQLQCIMHVRKQHETDHCWQEIKNTIIDAFQFWWHDRYANHSILQVRGVFSQVSVFTNYNRQQRETFSTLNIMIFFPGQVYEWEKLLHLQQYHDLHGLQKRTTLHRITWSSEMNNIPQWKRQYGYISSETWPGIFQVSSQPYISRDALTSVAFWYLEREKWIYGTPHSKGCQR